MDCSFIEKNLFRFQEDMLSPDERQLFLYHLKKCDKCLAKTEIFQLLNDHIDKVKKEPIKPFLFTRIQARIENTKKEFFWWQPIRYSTIAASLSLGILVGIFISKLTISEQDKEIVTISMGEVFNDTALESESFIISNQ